MNWLDLLRDYNVHYVTSGPNTGRGEVSIKCPFCIDDPSQHLGINLTTGNWGCLRNGDHRGKSPLRLIAALTGGNARLIAASYTHTDPDSFDAPRTVKPKTEGMRRVGWPSQFEVIQPAFRTYLSNRDLDTFCIITYNLRCCRIGRWAQRIIIPIYGPGPDMELWGWQGRAIVESATAPRYLTSHDQIKRTVFNLQNLNEGGEVLYVCEGPIDAMKLDYFGYPRHRATCTFGTSITPEQLLKLAELQQKFQRMVLLQDSDSAGISAQYNLSDWLPGAEMRYLHGTKDPGAMTGAEIVGWLNEQPTI